MKRVITIVILMIILINASAFGPLACGLKKTKQGKSAVKLSAQPVTQTGPSSPAIPSI